MRTESFRHGGGDILVIRGDELISLLFADKIKYRGVDAITQTGRGGTVRKDVAEMGAASRKATSVRTLPWFRSSRAWTLVSSKGANEAGRPQRESHRVGELNSGAPQQTLWNSPASWQSRFCW